MKIKNRRLGGLALAAASVALGSVVLAPVADAVSYPPPKVASSSDSHIKVQCRFTVTSVSYATGVVRARVTLSTRPVSYAAGRQVKDVHAVCNVEAEFPLGGVSVDANGPYSYKSQVLTLPLDAYTVCAGAGWHLKDGVTSGGTGSCV